MNKKEKKTEFYAIAGKIYSKQNENLKKFKVPKERTLPYVNIVRVKNQVLIVMYK